MSEPIHVNDADFESEIIQHQGVAMVDFWAEWCMPCRAVAPAIAELANEYDGKVKVAKLNVDDNPRTASHYGVMSIPTMLIFKDGKVVDQTVGAQPKEMLKKRLEQWVNKA